MRLLLDLPALLWCLGNPKELGRDTRSSIEKGDTPVVVSSVSAWEISLKMSLGKLRAPEDLEDQLDALDFSKLSLTFEHSRVLKSLPLLHRDPFDRMLVA